MIFKRFLPFVIHLCIFFPSLSQTLSINTGVNSIIDKNDDKNYESYAPFLELQLGYQIEEYTMLVASLNFLNNSYNVRKLTDDLAGSSSSPDYVSPKKVTYKINPSLSIGPLLHIPLGKIDGYLYPQVGIAFMTKANYEIEARYDTRTNYLSTTYENTKPGLMLEFDAGFLIPINDNLTIRMGASFFSANSDNKKIYKESSSNGQTSIRTSEQIVHYQFTGHQFIVGVQLPMGISKQ